MAKRLEPLLARTCKVNGPAVQAGGRGEERRGEERRGEEQDRRGEERRRRRKGKERKGKEKRGDDEGQGGRRRQCSRPYTQA